jgi:hypothetical protein
VNQSITHTTNHFSPAASLAALGVKLSQLDLFGPIRTQVQLRQKLIKHTPLVVRGIFQNRSSSRNIRHALQVICCFMLQ